MIEETSFEIGEIAKSLFDLDITPSGSWVGVTGFSDNDQSIYFENKKVKLPEKVRFPFIRTTDEETVLVVNARTRNTDNAWIINSSGETKASFFVGDAIEDVIITKDFIVVTQFDEAAASGGDGVCVYDFQGNRRFGYHEVFGYGTVDISDCYAAALVKENRVIFCPYTEFPMVLFDIEAKSQQIWEIPQAAKRFNAISKRGDKFYFHRIYRSKGYDFGIYEWQIGSATVQKIGEYQNHFTRGLPGGKFFARTESGYAIISVN